MGRVGGLLLDGIDVSAGLEWIEVDVGDLV